MSADEKASILVVDDNPAKRLALVSILEDLNQNLVTAESGRDALRLLLNHEYAVILMDVEMPQMDGFETARLIRSREHSADTPIIFVTAYAQADMDMLHGYSRGAVDYVFTPVIPDILRAKVSVFVDLFQKTREIRRHQHWLREKNLELESANKELEAFSYSVSHDLRAPLRHIDGYVGMLAEEAEGQLSAEAKRCLQVISDASRRMGQLIDDLLAFSRMNRAGIQMARVDLTTLVRESIRDLEMPTRGRNIEWKLALLPPTLGDRDMLRQVFANLLSNAVKYTGPRDAARIEIGTADPEDGRVTLFVRDNGVGFDMQYAGKLFGVFQRLHREEEFEGTGIGLANVRRIIARHGGRTWAEGKLDEGATFYFTLRSAESAPEP